MKKSLLIAQVAALARDIEMSEIDLREYGLKVDSYEVDDGESKKSSNAEQGEPVDLSNNGLLRGMDLHSRRLRLNQLLGEWEEPEEGNPVVSCQCPSSASENLNTCSNSDPLFCQ